MIQFVLVALLGASFALGEDDLREGKALTNTFPFNAQVDHSHDHHDGHHDGHHDDHGHHQPLSSRFSVRERSDRQRQLSQRQQSRRQQSQRQQSQRQQSQRQQSQGQQSRDRPPNFTEVANTRAGPDGKRCIDKVEMVEEIVYEDVVTCDHSYDQRCHTTYVTNYEAQQEEECEENFRKNCFIDYEKIAFNETVQICRIPLVKDCNVRGPDICSTHYESECWTTHEEHQVVDDVVSCNTEYERICKPQISGYTTTQECSEWPHEVCVVSKQQTKKYTPITGCTKEPIELCAPAGCKLVPAKMPECRNETQTIVQDKPKEECSLEPQRTCKHVTKLVPKLSPTEECVDVPKEVCSRSRVPKPEPVKRPVVKKWCYTPSAESGLA